MIEALIDGTTERSRLSVWINNGALSLPSLINSLAVINTKMKRVRAHRAQVSFNVVLQAEKSN